MEPAGASGRPLLGFTNWPPDITEEAVQTAERFIAAHADLAAIQLDNGVPWPESLSGAAYSDNLKQHLAYRPPPGKKLFVSITPLNAERSGLARYWGEHDDLPLPLGWRNKTFDDPDVMKAYAAYARRVVRAMSPDFLAIGVESNLLLTNSPSKWHAYRNLHIHVYQALKQAFPELPVFFTTEVLNLLGQSEGSDPDRQQLAVRRLLNYSDLFALSVYPYMSKSVPQPVPANYLDFATHFGKPVAVSETGYTSKAVSVGSITLNGSKALQESYYRLLLRTAKRDNYRFVVTFAGTDYDAMIEKLPPHLRELAGIWQFTGLQTRYKVAKPALAVWDRFRTAWDAAQPITSP